MCKQNIIIRVVDTVVNSSLKSTITNKENIKNVDIRVIKFAVSQKGTTLKKRDT